ncbi:lysosomal alpha-mannosidase isoform X2 [Manduca sexta]|uniref:lysosomal alpha-mannosidase isoform X2 n=1 Tax=Manduca sexta TaxID=7130 RepID=UPI00188F188E|nr:lysosomal alpha-mannosidase isoform X2 [Manduca sexta]
MLKLLLLYLAYIKCIVAAKAKIECGYKQCPQTRDGALNVHLISHSHMDAGWVKTFDEYYYGTKTSTSSANVQLVYHSVLSELLHDKRRKFTFSETGYFWRWWKEQRPTTRATFRTLVQEGRIEFAGGGWVHNDEATPDYLQIIDQYTWGLRKLNDTLGPCGKPKAAWQIDTYGHSREQASLLAQMGYDGLFIGRVDYRERETMIEEDRMEFMWRGSDVLGKMSDIMSHTLFNLYNAPEGFCFDFLCNDEPIVDDPDSKVYNADKRVNDFIAQIERQAKYYDHDNIMVTMGGDFTYQSAANWFVNIDKLINHVNTHPANLSDINIFYSTPSCYLKAIYLYGRRDKAVFTEKGDHLPYASDTTTYWTGYYTSRPSLKYLIRRAHVFLQVVKQLTVLARMGDSYELHLLRHAVSLVLHHDAITGTSQQHVTNDFIRILAEAMEACSKKISHLLSYLTPTWGGSRRSKSNQQFFICHQLNMSQCSFTEMQEPVLLLVYNPLSTKTYFHVRVPAFALHYSIRDYNDEEVEYQLVSLPASMINLPGRSSTSIQELFFEAENIPPLGFTAYYITPVRDQLEENAFAKKKVSETVNNADEELTPHISNEYLKVLVDKTTGLLSSIQHIDGVRVEVAQNFFFYSQGQQIMQSGAYTFRPEKTRPKPVTDRVSYTTVRGPLVKEIRQRFNDWLTQIIRLYRGEEFVELEWLIGPVPFGNDLGKEVVSIFTTNITNHGEFFTDSNSRQMMKRTCWNHTANHQKKPLPACYYPVTSRICIHSANSSVEMCVLTDRTQGGTSYNEGEIELMIHRRLLTDDGFGLEESLNEEEFNIPLVVKGKHRIIFGNFKQEVDDLTFSERAAQAARRWQMEPWLFFTSGEKISRRKWQNVRNKRFSALKLHGLPRHIHVLTLEPWKGGSVLLRLENTLETTNREKADAAEDFTKPSHITVELRKIFLQMEIRMVRETTLAANQWLDDARQMDWSTRYVYNGSEDGILPEDVEDTEDKPVKQVDVKESDSYEEPRYTRDKFSRPKYHEKSRFKTNYDPFLRRKRSVNSTINILDNIINDTKYTPNYILNTTKERNVFKNASVKTQLANLAVTLKLPTLSFLSKKPRHSDDWTSEVTSSEEDLSTNLKKRSHVSKNGRLKMGSYEDFIYDDSDDGVTKSIYEMYYKVKPRRNSFKPFIRSSEEEEKPRRKKKTRVMNDYDDVTTRKNKRHRKAKGRGEKQYFIAESGRKYFIGDGHRSDRRRGEDTEEYQMRAVTKSYLITRGKRIKKSSKEDEYSDVEDTLTEYRENKRTRVKRTLQEDHPEPNSEEPDPTEPDYVVTLRPTQIRTFVIWFESSKNYAK